MNDRDAANKVLEIMERVVELKTENKMLREQNDWLKERNRELFEAFYNLAGREEHIKVKL